MPDHQRRLIGPLQVVDDQHRGGGRAQLVHQRHQHLDAGHRRVAVGEQPRPPAAEQVGGVRPPRVRRTRPHLQAVQHHPQRQPLGELVRHRPTRCPTPARSPPPGPRRPGTTCRCPARPRPRPPLPHHGRGPRYRHGGSPAPALRPTHCGGRPIGHMAVTYALPGAGAYSTPTPSRITRQELRLRRAGASGSTPQLATHVGLMRMTSRLMNGTGGSTSSSATAVPRISRPRTVHGSARDEVVDDEGDPAVGLHVAELAGGAHGVTADEDVAGLLVEERADRVVLRRAARIHGGEAGQGLALQVGPLGLSQGDSHPRSVKPGGPAGSPGHAIPRGSANA